MTERVLVTGAGGYVGRQVVLHLSELGKNVVAVHHRSSGPPGQSVQVDLTNGNELADRMADSNFDWIIHLASLPGDTGSPEQMVRTNVDGCLNVLELARRQKVRRFLLASSISAYGWYPAARFEPPISLPVTEDHPCRPKDMYSTTKRMQELLALTYYYQYGLPVTILRLTAVVGPRGSGGGRSWRAFAEQLADRKSLQIPHFTAEELCHYVDSRDVARLVAAAAKHPAAVGETFNCAGPTPTRGVEFVEIVRRLIPDIDVVFGFPWSMAQGGEICFDMTKAKNLIGFEPLFSMADSLSSIKAWVDAGGLREKVIEEKFGAGMANQA